MVFSNLRRRESRAWPVRSLYSRVERRMAGPMTQSTSTHTPLSRSAFRLNQKSAWCSLPLHTGRGDESFLASLPQTRP